MVVKRSQQYLISLHYRNT